MGNHQVKKKIFLVAPILNHKYMSVKYWLFNINIEY